MFKKMLIGAALGLVAVGAGAATFERLAPSAWVAPLAAMGEHGEKNRKGKAVRLDTERELKDKLHDRRRHDD